MWLMSEKRSLSAVAKSSKFQCSVANISRWSRMYDWQGRAWAYDAEQDELQRLQLARDRVAMRNRHLQLALQMQSIAANGLAEWQEKIRQKLPLNLTAEGCKALMAEGTKLEKETLGTEKEKQYTQITVNLGDYKDEEQYEDALRGDGPLKDTLENEDGPLLKKPN